MVKKKLETIVSEGTNEFGEKFEAVQLLPELRKRYPTELKTNILSIRFYQTEKACYLEITEELNPDKLVNEMDELIEGKYSSRDYITTRKSLYFITGDIIDEYHATRYFMPSTPVLENALRFINEFDDDSMLNCTDIFSDEGAEDLVRRMTGKKK
jgi:hypothetical protein